MLTDCNNHLASLLLQHLILCKVFLLKVPACNMAQICRPLTPYSDGDCDDDNNANACALCRLHRLGAHCSDHYPMTVSTCFCLSSSASFSASNRVTVTLLVLNCPKVTAAAIACVLKQTGTQHTFYRQVARQHT